MIKSNFRTIATAGALAFGALGLAAAVHAAQTSVKTGNFAGAIAQLPSECNSGVYYSYFGVGLSSASLTCTSPRPTGALARATMKWKGDSPRSNSTQVDDYVTGIGYKPASANKTRTVKFRINTFTFSNAQTTATDPKLATVGVYGWLCPSSAQIKDGFERTEYYVVDRWAGSFGVPFGTRSYGTTTLNGKTYNLYYSGIINRGHGCGSGDANFRQLWAVRSSSNTSTTSDVSINMGTFFSAFNNLKNGKGKSVSASPAGYQIVGVEGLGATQGTVTVTLK